MGKKQDYTAIRVWKKEIKRRSNSYSNRFKGIAAVFVVVFLSVVAILNVIFPKNGTSLIFLDIKISSTTKDILSAIAAVVAILASLELLPPVKGWYYKPRRRYRGAAVQIIAQLREESLIDDTDEIRLMSVVGSRLDATEDPTFQGDAEELLCQACSEMAAVVREKSAGVKREEKREGAL